MLLLALFHHTFPSLLGSVVSFFIYVMLDIKRWITLKTHSAFTKSCMVTDVDLDSTNKLAKLLANSSSNQKNRMIFTRDSNSYKQWIGTSNGVTPAVNNSLHRLASVHTLVNAICARKIARAFGVCVAAA